MWLPVAQVLENVYTGPHSAHVPKRFSTTACSQAMATAALGFVPPFNSSLQNNDCILPYIYGLSATYCILIFMICEMARFYHM